MRDLLRLLRIITFVMVMFIMALYYNTLLALHCIFRHSKASDRLDRTLANSARSFLYITKIFTGLAFTFYEKQTFLNTKFDEPILIIANHQSILDIFVMMAIFQNIPIRFVLKKSIKRWVTFGSAIVRVQRMAIIDRQDPRQSIKEIRRLARYAILKKYSIVVFPEGTRSKNGKLLDFHTAGIRTILKNNPLPIALVALHNSYKVTSLRTAKFEKIPYHVKLLHVYPPTKHSEVFQVLEDARKRISHQLDEWNKNDGISNSDL